MDDFEDDGGGWWSRSPGWARGVVVGGVVLVLLLVGALGGLVLGQRTAPSYGPPPGAVDVAFLQDMAVHHNQAVQMAVWERNNTTDPALRQLAFDIESTQNQQIGMMQGWLRLWEQPTEAQPGQYMAWMGMPSAAMPGMASDADLARFTSQTGTPMDVAFLQLILRHHRGGLSMMQEEADRGSVSVVTQLARSMVASQTAEADTMTQMLAARGAAPLRS
ncbi:DUF305 domain-containing protein [Actinomycetospora endophytica]|uniref:DUF305 domain-containing protein n=1 Tax=Actinomycetospora endophytica TaxID=2291215 RepID=A0ABS8PF94_9PSEU|nr:DUF305 domain-containing protein [Actinomycetospora endophytica]MCD2196921.1 DUF305 domain-containing protein [Actinomycetospora endophytica]